MAYKQKSPIIVAEGGSGIQSATAYSVLTGGTTSTGAFQSVSGVGTSGQILTSNGAGTLPTWQAAPGAGSGSTLLLTQTASSSASLVFNSTYVTTAYNTYRLVFKNLRPSATGALLEFWISTNNGSSYITSSFCGMNANAYNAIPTANSPSTAGNCPVGQGRTSITYGTSGAIDFILNGSNTTTLTMVS